MKGAGVVQIPPDDAGADNASSSDSALFPDANAVSYIYIDTYYRADWILERVQERTFSLIHEIWLGSRKYVE